MRLFNFLLLALVPYGGLAAGTDSVDETDILSETTTSTTSTTTSSTTSSEEIIPEYTTSSSSEYTTTTSTTSSETTHSTISSSTTPHYPTTTVDTRSSTSSTTHTTYHSSSDDEYRHDTTSSSSHTDTSSTDSTHSTESTHSTGSTHSSDSDSTHSTGSTYTTTRTTHSTESTHTIRTTEDTRSPSSTSSSSSDHSVSYHSSSSSRSSSSSHPYPESSLTTATGYRRGNHSTTTDSDETTSTSTSSESEIETVTEYVFPTERCTAGGHLKCSYLSFEINPTVYVVSTLTIDATAPAPSNDIVGTTTFDNADVTVIGPNDPILTNEPNLVPDDGGEVNPSRTIVFSFQWVTSVDVGEPEPTETGTCAPQTVYVTIPRTASVDLEVFKSCSPWPAFTTTLSTIGPRTKTAVVVVRKGDEEVDDPKTNKNPDERKTTSKNQDPFKDPNKDNKTPTNTQNRTPNPNNNPKTTTPNPQLPTLNPDDFTKVTPPDSVPRRTGSKTPESPQRPRPTEHPEWEPLIDPTVKETVVDGTTTTTTEFQGFRLVPKTTEVQLPDGGKSTMVIMTREKIPTTSFKPLVVATPEVTEVGDRKVTYLSVVSVSPKPTTVFYTKTTNGKKTTYSSVLYLPTTITIPQMGPFLTTKKAPTVIQGIPTIGPVVVTLAPIIKTTYITTVESGTTKIHKTTYRLPDTTTLPDPFVTIIEVTTVIYGTKTIIRFPVSLSATPQVDDITTTIKGKKKVIKTTVLVPNGIPVLDLPSVILDTTTISGKKTIISEFYTIKPVRKTTTIDDEETVLLIPSAVPITTPEKYFSTSFRTTTIDGTKTSIPEIYFLKPTSITTVIDGKSTVVETTTKIKVSSTTPPSKRPSATKDEKNEEPTTGVSPAPPPEQTNAASGLRLDAVAALFICFVSSFILLIL